MRDIDNRLLLDTITNENVFSKHLISMLKFISFEKSHCHTRRFYDVIVYKSIYILTNTIQDLAAVLSKFSLLFSLNIFLNVSELIGLIFQISRIFFHVAHLLYLRRVLLTNLTEYFVEGFIIIADLLDQSIRSLELCIIYILRYILAIIVLIIKISAAC